MQKRKFKMPPKIKGQSQSFLNTYVEPEFRQALKEFADRQSLNSGIKVSMGNVIQETVSRSRWVTLYRKR